jgi:hypothetical protein
MRVPRRVFRLPSRGGLLAILNCVFWLVFIWAGQKQWLDNLPVPLIVIFAFAFSIPVLCFQLLPGSHVGPDSNVWFGIVVAVNSFLWGYGISHLWSIMFERKRKQNRLEQLYRMNICPQCGYDLRATPNRCPECGNVPPWASQSKLNQHWADRLDQM